MTTGAAGLTLIFIFGSIALTFFVLALVFAPLAWLIHQNRKKLQALQQILETGLRGEATILSLTETGIHSNGRVDANIRLTVRLPGEAPYEATMARTVSLLEAPRLQPGAVVAVAVSPADRQVVVIDMSAGVPGLSVSR